MPILAILFLILLTKSPNWKHRKEKKIRGNHDLLCDVLPSCYLQPPSLQLKMRIGTLHKVSLCALLIYRMSIFFIINFLLKDNRFTEFCCFLSRMSILINHLNLWKSDLNTCKVIHPMLLLRRFNRVRLCATP